MWAGQGWTALALLVLFIVGLWLSGTPADRKHQRVAGARVCLVVCRPALLPPKKCAKTSYGSGVRGIEVRNFSQVFASLCNFPQFPAISCNFPQSFCKLLFVCPPCELVGALCVPCAEVAP